MTHRQRGFLIAALLVAGLAVLPAASRASTIVLNPVDDGSLYTCSGCNPSPVRSYVLVSGYIVGDIDFQNPMLGGSIENALLSVNPYALPLFGPQISVYGVASTSATISLADLASLTFLGTWTLPANLTFGQPAYFDVTSFLEGVQSPYVAFVLETPSAETDVFSSTETNYGLPPQMTITTPEPAALALLGAGLLALLGGARRKAFRA